MVTAKGLLVINQFQFSHVPGYKGGVGEEAQINVSWIISAVLLPQNAIREGLLQIHPKSASYNANLSCLFAFLSYPLPVLVYLEEN